MAYGGEGTYEGSWPERVGEVALARELRAHGFTLEEFWVDNEWAVWYDSAVVLGWLGY